MGDLSPAPRHSSADLELKAEQVLRHFRAEVLESPVSTPIAWIIAESKKQFGLQFECKDLGYSEGGKKILGAFRFHPRCIIIDASLQNDSRVQFVLRHEFGHYVLHRRLVLSKKDYPPIVDTQRDLITGRKNLRTPRDWIEWQANRFSAALLMPRATFRTALIKAQQDIGMASRLGTVYVEDKSYSLRDFALLKEQMALRGVL